MSANGDENRQNDSTSTSCWAGQIRGSNYYKHMGRALSIYKKLMNKMVEF